MFGISAFELDAGQIYSGTRLGVYVESDSLSGTSRLGVTGLVLNNWFRYIGGVLSFWNSSTSTWDVATGYTVVRLGVNAIDESENLPLIISRGDEVSWNVAVIN